MNRSEVEGALNLLVNASRVSPPLRAAVQEVEDEIRRLRDALYEIIDLHQPAEPVPARRVTCVICGPADGSWPCTTRIIAADMFARAEMDGAS